MSNWGLCRFRPVSESGRNFRGAFLGLALAPASIGVAFGADQAPPVVKASPPNYTNEFRRAFWDDAEFNIHFRSYYLERDNPAPPGLAALAAGGWLGYQSGWYANFLRVGVVGYTSQPVWAPDHRDGTLLLRPGQEGYGVIGQAYVSLKAGDHVFTGYRQLINQPEVNPQDNRMTPNTFEAYGFEGNLGPVSYYAGYLARMKKRNSSTFADMAEAAAGSGVSNEGMWLGTLKYAPTKEFYARASGFHVQNVLNSSYADFWGITPLTGNIKWAYGAQIMYQAGDGANFITGGVPFSTWSGGVKSDFIAGPFTLMLAYTQTGDNSFYRSPYGSWAGYTSMIVRDFNRAGEQAYLIGMAYDFKDWNLPGLVFTTNAVFGRNAINPATGAPLIDTDEYDFTLDYRFTAQYWPEHLRPLWVRLRYVHINDHMSGTSTHTDDYRVIVNYDLLYNGRGVRK